MEDNLKQQAIWTVGKLYPMEGTKTLYKYGMALPYYLDIRHETQFHDEDSVYIGDDYELELVEGCKRACLSP